MDRARQATPWPLIAETNRLATKYQDRGTHRTTNEDVPSAGTEDLPVPDKVALM